MNGQINGQFAVHHLQTTESTGTLLNVLLIVRTAINKSVGTNTTELLTTTTRPTTYLRDQQDRKTIDKATNLINNRPTDF